MTLAKPAVLRADVSSNGAEGGNREWNRSGPFFRPATEAASSFPFALDKTSISRASVTGQRRATSQPKSPAAKQHTYEGRLPEDSRRKTVGWWIAAAIPYKCVPRISIPLL